MFMVGLTGVKEREESASPKIPPSALWPLTHPLLCCLADVFHSFPQQRSLFLFLVILCPSGRVHLRLLSRLPFSSGYPMSLQSKDPKQGGTPISLSPLNSPPFRSHSTWALTQQDSTTHERGSRVLILTKASFSSSGFLENTAMILCGETLKMRCRRVETSRS